MEHHYVGVELSEACYRKLRKLSDKQDQCIADIVREFIEQALSDKKK